MPLPGYPLVMTLAEWLAWHAGPGKSPVTETGQSLRDRYWNYVLSHGGPNLFERAAAAAPVTPTPPIPDSLTALLTQRAALPDIYNPQRHTIAAQGAATLEGQGFADPGTATITEQRARRADGTEGPDIKYFVFRGADGRLYRQAYMAVQNTGAQRGSLYTSGNADDVATGKQQLDYQRQNILTGVETGQNNLLAREAGDYSDITGKYQGGLEQWNTQAPATVASLAPPPPPKPPASAKPKPPVLTRAQWIAYHQKNRIPVKGTYEEYTLARR